MGEASIERLRGGTWIIPGPTNVGVVELPGGVCLVDSGNDKDSGRAALRALEARGWRLGAVFNTHSNADHIGGNRYLQDKTGCEIWATAGEARLIETPLIEPSLLWGGRPPAGLRSKFFEAKGSRVTAIVADGELREGLRIVGLPGHFIDQAGLLTGDGVLFLGDALFGERILEKHRIPFVYDVAAFRSSAAKAAAMGAELYVPSHGEPTADIGALAAANLRRVDEVEAAVLEALGDGAGFEDALGRLCAAFGVALDLGQYALVGSTLRSFLSYLLDEGKAACAFEGGRPLWRRTSVDAAGMAERR